MGENMKTITAVLSMNEYHSINSLQEKINVPVTGIMMGDCLEKNEKLKVIIEQCWEAIQEAGYEDHCAGLRDKIEKAVD